MEKVAAAVQTGHCHFEKVSKETLRELTICHQQEIALGQVVPPPPRKERSDKFDTRGCHLNPATRTKTRRRGKMKKSLPMVREDSDTEYVSEIEDWESEAEGGEAKDVSEIEDWEESEMDGGLDSDPISDW